jgi:hypothetical protein
MKPLIFYDQKKHTTNKNSLDLDRILDTKRKIKIKNSKLLRLRKSWKAHLSSSLGKCPRNKVF